MTRAQRGMARLPVWLKACICLCIAAALAFGWLVSFSRPFHAWHGHAVQALIVGVLALVLLASLLVRREPPLRDEEKAVHDDLLSEFESHVAAMLAAQRNYAMFEDGGLFRRFFIAQARQLAQEMDAAAGRQSLDVTPRGHTTRPLLDSLTGEPSDVCKFVHHLDNNRFFFQSRHSIDFFLRIHTAVQKGQIKLVRRVFVYPDGEPHDFDAIWNNPQTQRLLAFHENVEGFEWRMISAEDFSVLGLDEDIYDAHLDLGLYGGRYAYLSSQRPRSGSQASGTFVAAKAEVARLDEFFELIWQRGATHGPTALGPCATVEDLFQIDDHTTPTDGERVVRTHGVAD
jgi:hypothetical protein